MEKRSMTEKPNKRIMGVRALASVLVALMFFAGIFAVSTTPAEAASGAKLSAGSVTVAMGGSRTIKLYNAKEGKWTLRSNGVAKIKKRSRQYVTVVPLKAGTTTLTCKVGRKTLKCKVRILNNSIGKPAKLFDDDTFFCLAGSPREVTVYIPEGDRIDSMSYNRKIGTVRIVKTTRIEPDDEDDCTMTEYTLSVRGLKPGKMKLDLMIARSDGSSSVDSRAFIFINDFRGRAKVKKTSANYAKWRRKTISSMVSADMTTWEIIGAIDTLISTGRYSSRGGATGIQLWYGTNGTCVSGAQMMDDFMKDLGIKSKIHFMGKAKNSVDINHLRVQYGKQHKNTWITLGGKRYELNPQPGIPWPAGVVMR